MAQYAIANEDIRDVASRLIEEEFQNILENEISVGFIASDQCKKKGPDHIIFGECSLVPEKWKVFCPFDFLITIYEPNCVGFSDDQMKTLLLHELLHIGINEKGKLYVKPHDVEEFNRIISEKGLHWAT